jgi:hypothetical protein
VEDEVLTFPNWASDGGGWSASQLCNFKPGEEYPITIRQEEVWCVMWFSRKKSDFYIASICIYVQDDESGAEA